MESLLIFNNCTILFCGFKDHGSVSYYAVNTVCWKYATIYIYKIQIPLIHWSLPLTNDETVED